MAALACRFSKGGCAHEDGLFKPAYQRVNRARGTKILRCFPHCCPAHIPRSYCGATIDLEVHHGTRFHPQQLIVFARFRLRDEDASLRVGDRVALAAITYGLQSPSNTKAPWIQSQPRSVQDHAMLVFEINPGRRWYYPWDSSKNSATRATKHVLEAFVFVRHGDTLQCVAIATSPNFTLVSFRRVSASETALIAEELKNDKLSRSPVATRESLRPSLRVLIKEEPADRVERHAVVTTLDPLAVLFHVANQFPIGHATLLLPKWISLGEKSGHAQNAVFQDALHVAVHVVVWLRLDETIQSAWRDHTRRGASVLLDCHALRACHGRWMRWLVSHVECFLATLEQPPLQELSALVTTRGYAGNGPYCFDWLSFVAQAREVFTGLAVPSPEALQRLRSGGLWACALASVSVASLEGSQHDNADLDSHRSLQHLPSAALLAFWQQLHRVHVDLNTQSSPPELTIASPSSIQSNRPVMRLLLDNRYRIFHTWPHGEATSSTALPGFNGDYIATMRRDGTIEIHLFSWPTESTLTGFRWSWMVKRCDLLTPVDQFEWHLTVSAAVFERPLGADSATLPIRDKLVALGRWRDVYKAHLPYTRP